MTPGAERLLPGVVLLAVVAGTAQALATAVPQLPALAIAIAIGAIIVNTVGLPAWTEPGIEKHALLLETAIVLLGASLSLEAVIAAGSMVATLILAVVVFGLVSVTALSRVANLNDRMGSLLAAGASICGVSAIAAVAPACEADDIQIAHAAATILLFDAVTLVAFPVIGRILGLDPQFYGVWIGLAMFSTGPVAAAGFAHSPTAGEWATVTKLARNALIGIVAVWYSIRYAGRSGEETPSTTGQMWTDFPKFLIGFVLLAILTNAGLIPDPALDSIATTSDALFLLAFAGLGFQIDLGEIRGTGIAPVGVVGTYLLLVSGLTYVLVTVSF